MIAVDPAKPGHDHSVFVPREFFLAPDDPLQQQLDALERMRRRMVIERSMFAAADHARQATARRRELDRSVHYAAFQDVVRRTAKLRLAMAARDRAQSMARAYFARVGRMDLAPEVLR